MPNTIIKSYSMNTNRTKINIDTEYGQYLYNVGGGRFQWSLEGQWTPSFNIPLRVQELVRVIRIGANSKKIYESIFASPNVHGSPNTKIRRFNTTVDGAPILDSHNGSCECGISKIYGKDCSSKMHSEWCPEYKG